MGRLQDNQYAPLIRKQNQDNTKVKEERANNEAKLQATFCPPLDPSLIQAIWNDSYNYDASFEILSSLAKDADQTLDQQDMMQAMEQLELDESTTTTTTTEGEDENVNFLLNCFPTLPLDELVDALKSQDNDVEKATDLLLSREFLQEAERAGGAVLDKSQNENMYYTRKDDVSNKKKPKNNKKKKGTVWTSGQLPNTQASAPRIVDDDPYAELATVPFNCWHQYDAIVNSIQWYFPNVPKITVATCVQHCRGNIIASVKMIMEKHPEEKPEHELSWSSLKELTSVKEELEAIMVDRTPDDVYRVSVGVIIKFEGKNVSTEHMVQDGIEHFLTFDVNQMELEARLKKMAKESETIRRTKQKNGMPVIPDYLLINNQQDYQDDDPEECRDIAMQLIMERNELFRKAASAYRQSKNKGPGEGGIAFYYSDTARQIDSRAKDWNMRAARATVRGHRIRQNDDHLLDLHGLTVAEAQVLVKEGVTQWWSRSQMQSARRQFQPLKIVTGVGKHSHGGESKLLPATTKWLRKEGWLFEMTNPGCIYVKGVVNKK
ncbi:uncharacterized protein EV154DRAFT_516754 [Mucor mucedo]|uniref:uncharacterized protein n=1 Tax=Mucor mucedo TaxID=29922 RepID=UPI00221F8F30|nr:uncharacterized protein EV154DRAFT_516754 [Mucor mucedo]KAI7888767.1 hypothetical protein EV154DRAFT_516754 [Mucor mucedo]